VPPSLPSMPSIQDKLISFKQRFYADTGSLETCFRPAFARVARARRNKSNNKLFQLAVRQALWSTPLYRQANKLITTPLDILTSKSPGGWRTAQDPRSGHKVSPAVFQVTAMWSRTKWEAAVVCCCSCRLPRDLSSPLSPGSTNFLTLPSNLSLGCH
jgi:hypothetical protein